jgi:hypothetical protein
MANRFKVGHCKEKKGRDRERQRHRHFLHCQFRLDFPAAASSAQWVRVGEREKQMHDELKQIEGNEERQTVQQSMPVSHSRSIRSQKTQKIN